MRFALLLLLSALTCQAQTIVATGFQNLTPTSTNIQGPTLTISLHDTVYVFCGQDGNHAFTMTATDSHSAQTFVAIGSPFTDSFTVSTNQWFVAKDTAAQATETIVCNYSSSATNRVIGVFQLSGANNTSPTDASANGTAGGTTSVTSGTFNTNFANELILACAVGNNGAAPTLSAGSGYTLKFSNGFNNDPPFGGETKLVTTFQSGVTASFTSDVTLFWSLSVITVKSTTQPAAITARHKIMT